MKILSKPVLLEGKMTVSRPSYSSGKEVITITLEDKVSGCIVNVVEMQLADFAKMLTGLAFVSCSFELYEGPIGLKREVKNEKVYSIHPHANNDDLAKILKPFLVDGWQLNNPSDLTNMHTHFRDETGDGHRVNFVRWVQPKESETNETTKLDT